MPRAMNIRSPISGLVRPCGSKLDDASSVGVSDSQPPAGRLREPRAGAASRARSRCSIARPCLDGSASSARRARRQAARAATRRRPARRPSARAELLAGALAGAEDARRLLAALEAGGDCGEHDERAASCGASRARRRGERHVSERSASPGSPRASAASGQQGAGARADQRVVERPPAIFATAAAASAAASGSRRAPSSIRAAAPAQAPLHGCSRRRPARRTRSLRARRLELAGGRLGVQRSPRERRDRHAGGGSRRALHRRPELGQRLPRFAALGQHDPR